MRGQGSRPCSKCCSQGWAEGQLSLQCAHPQGSVSHISLTLSKKARSFYRWWPWAC